MEIADSNGVYGKGIEIALVQMDSVVSYKSLDTQTSSKKETITTTCTKKYCQYFSLLKVVLLRDPDVNPVLQLRDPLREARGLLESSNYAVLVQLILGFGWGCSLVYFTALGNTAIPEVVDKVGDPGAFGVHLVGFGLLQWGLHRLAGGRVHW